MKRICLIMAFFVAWLPFVGAENNQAIIPHDSSVMNELTSIYLEEGKTTLSTGGPFSIDEIRLMLDKIDWARLSAAGKVAYDDINKYLTALIPPKPSPLHFQLHPEIALQGYFHTNPDPSTTYWEYLWPDRLPLISLPIEGWGGDAAYVVMDLDLRQCRDAYDPSLVPANYSNIPLNFDFVDVETPFRAFLSVGGHDWSFMIGRDHFSWGNGETGNFALSDSPDYYDFARLTGYWSNFKYTAMWVSLLTNLAPYESPPVLTAAELEAGYTFQDYPRNYFLHRLEFTPWDQLGIGISEGTIIGGVLPKLEYFNPLMIFHNLFNYYNASEILAIEATYVPFRNIEVYGQFSCTSLQIPFDFARWGSEATTVPDGWGALAGIRTRWPLADGFMDDGIEFAYVNPWLYIKQNPLTTFEWWRNQASNVPGSTQWVSAPLGYFTGPDSIVTEIWARYRVPGSFSTGLSYILIFKGENTLDTPYQQSAAAASLAAPSGEVEIKSVVHIAGTMDPYAFMSLGLDLYGVVTQNFGNVAGVNVMDLQVVVSARFRF